MFEFVFVCVWKKFRWLETNPRSKEIQVDSHFQPEKIFHRQELEGRLPMLGQDISLWSARCNPTEHHLKFQGETVSNGEEPGSWSVDLHLLAGLEQPIGNKDNEGKQFRSKFVVPT